jgi:ABC-2 type transport system ATP-binding protein
VSGAPPPTVEVHGLVKRYDGRAVVDGLDLVVERGEILALLGPNGAGKTTTVEILEGFRRADEGSVRVLGLDPRVDGSQLRARIGLMLQRAELYSQIRVGEAVRLFAAFYAAPLAAGPLLESVGLAARAGDRYRSLSGGERQRLDLALAIVGRPELAILDEPTAAMDVTARRATWELLRTLRAEGATILLTTHLLEEAEQLADRVAIIDRGRLVALGTPQELRGSAGAGGDGSERHVSLELAMPLTAEDEATLARLEHVAGVGAPLPGRYVLTTRSPGALLAEVTAWLLARGIETRAIEVERERLEDVFVRLTGDGAAPR